MTEKELLLKINHIKCCSIYSPLFIKDVLEALRQIPPEELCKVSQCDYFYVNGTKSVDYYHELQWRKLG